MRILQRSLLCVAMVAFIAVGDLQGQTENSPEASLWVNQNTGTNFPLSASMGELDPNLIVVSGPPREEFQVHFGRYRARLRISLNPNQWHLRPGSVFHSIDGILDKDGRASILLPPGTITRDQRLAVQAIVGPVFSGATAVQSVRTMSATPDVAMQPGSVANILGPITSIDSNAIFVGNLEYRLTVDTIFGNEPFENLEVGEWVDMVGEFNAAGGLDAVEVNAEDAEDEVRIRARIQGLGPSGFALLGVSVYTASSTEFVDWETGVPLQFEDLQIAMPVEIRIPFAAEGFPIVTSAELSVEIEPEPEPEPEPEDEDPPSPPPAFCS